MISLRPVGPGDEDFLFRVYRSTREAELGLLDWTDAQKHAFVRMQFDAQRSYYAQFFSDASHDVILVEDRPAGRLYVVRWPSEIRVVDIALLPEFRNRGIGSTLLRELMAEAAAADLPVSIHVERFNPALALYQRLGFTLAEDKGVYMLLQWRERSALT